LWTTRLLAQHVREHGPAAGHACLAHLAQGTLCKILARHEVKPHKVRYYLERRDPEFEKKMAEVLCVYREVALLKQNNAEPGATQSEAVAIVSYDEKAGVQAIGATASDLPPAPGRHRSFARDHEYVRHGALSLLAGIDLLTGAVHASVEERHRSREFVAFLEKLDAAYPPATAIKIILDNHSAHISREKEAASMTRAGTPARESIIGRRICRCRSSWRATGWDRHSSRTPRFVPRLARIGLEWRRIRPVSMRRTRRSAASSIPIRPSLRSPMKRSGALRSRAVNSCLGTASGGR